jgi:hypothetical protein
MTQTQPAQQQQSYRWVILVAMCVIGFMTIGTRSTVRALVPFDVIRSCMIVLDVTALEGHALS